MKGRKIVKTIIIILVLLSLIIGVGIFLQNMLINESHGMITNLENMTNLIRAEKWKDAKADMSRLVINGSIFEGDGMP